MELIKQDNHITISEIIKKTGFSRATVNRNISTLKEKQILYRIGAKKKGQWIVKE